MKILLLFSFLLTSFASLFAQSNQPDEYFALKDNQASFQKTWRKAKKERGKRDLDAALGLYESAIKMDSTDAFLLYEVATLYDSLEAFVAANRYYHKVADTDEAKQFAMLPLQHAKVLQKLGDYAKAIEHYYFFLQQQTEGSARSNAYIQQAKTGIEKCKEAQKLRDDPNADFGNILVLNDPVNDISRVTAEFAPYYENGELYFSRFQYADENKEDFKLNVFKHKATDAGVFLALPNSTQNAYITIHPNSQILYEVGCSGKVKDFTNRDCRIYSRHRLGNNKWSDRQALPKTINQKDALNTQPVIIATADGKEYLYFSSDREGGSGGMDLWSSEITYDEQNEPQYAEAVNLTQLNTSADEISPSYHQKCEMLYFSSDRRPTLGGFDIYQAEWNGAAYGWKKIENLREPINSSFDDVDFFRTATGEKAFFASKRVPAEERDGNRVVKGCCLDIFEADVNLPVNLELAVQCGKDTLVTDAYYSFSGLSSKSGAANMQDSSRLIKNPILLAANDQYSFNINKPNWTTAQLQLATTNICQPTTFSEKVYIRPYDNLYINIKGLTANGIRALDFVKVTLVNQYGIEQTKEVEGGLAVFKAEVGATDMTYQVYIEKEDYLRDTLQVVIPPVEQVCITEVDAILMPELINKDLAVALYFHDDIPAIENYNDERQVAISYEQTYNNYYSPEMRNTYKQGLIAFFDANNEPYTPDEVDEKIDSFFIEEVKFGFNQLETYAYFLVNHFVNGTAVPLSIQIKGSASPTARSQAGIRYNQKLSSRRINSVKNYLSSYENGVLASYIEDGQLNIEEVPIGQNVENLSQFEINKIKNNDDTYGIYSPTAAKTRKVTIEKISLQPIQ